MAKARDRFPGRLLIAVLVTAWVSAAACSCSNSGGDSRTLSCRFIADARSMRRMRSLPLEAEASHSIDQMTLHEERSGPLRGASPASPEKIRSVHALLPGRPLVRSVGVVE